MIVSNSIVHFNRTFQCNGETIDLLTFDTVSSTMDVARDLLINGSKPWTVVTADCQTSGRGTHGRDWLSLKDAGLYISIILPSPRSTDTIECLTVDTACILAETIDTLATLKCSIKHPNDLYAGGRKIAGILYESSSYGDFLSSIILGMGVNLSQSHEDFMRAGLPDATSVFAETGVKPDREQLLLAFLDTFVPMYRIASG